MREPTYAEGKLPAGRFPSGTPCKWVFAEYYLLAHARGGAAAGKGGGGVDGPPPGFYCRP